MTSELGKAGSMGEAKKVGLKGGDGKSVDLFEGGVCVSM